MIIRLIVGTLLGGISGYALYYYVGCKTGSCPITANPWLSTAWGVTLGILITWK